MLTRISLVIVILAGIGAIVFGQMQVKQKIDEAIQARNTFHTNWKNEERKRQDLEKQLEETKAQLSQAQAQLAVVQQQLDAKDKEITILQAEVTRLNDSLRIARAERDKAQAELTQYQLTGLRPDEIKEVIARLKQSLEDIKGLEATVVDRNRQIDNLKIRIQELVGDEAPVILPAGLKGKVVTVDPKWDFVVINLGKNDGLLLNGQMLVARDGKLLAKVRIVNVMEDKAIANVLAGSKLDEILEGDTVLY